MDRIVADLNVVLFVGRSSLCGFQFMDAALVHSQCCFFSSKFKQENDLDRGTDGNPGPEQDGDGVCALV